VKLNVMGGKTEKQVSRREVLRYGVYGGFGCGLGPALWLGGCGKAGKPAAPKGAPNIVFILIDALRADRLPCYGYPIDTAPNISGLAENGVLFRKVIAPSSWTKTSMASIMTSREAPRHGVLGVEHVLPKSLTTLGQVLYENGYYNIGVNANPWLKAKFNFAAGFDSYKTFDFDGDTVVCWDMNTHALAELNKTEAGRPVFLYVHDMEVHAPYRPESPFFEKPPLAIAGLGMLPDSEIEHRYRKRGLKGPAIQERVIELYDADIKTSDAAIGELVEGLKKASRFENTIFIITSDHGESFREHGTTEHGQNLYPEVYEVPLLLVWPGHLRGHTEITAQVRSIDIAPTLLELAGLAPCESFEGKSFALLADEQIGSRLAVAEVGPNDYIPELEFVAVISAEHLYVKEKTSGTVEFYDLRADPTAHNNLGLSHPSASAYAKLAEAAGTDVTAEKMKLDEQTRRQLESLGYLR